MKTQNSITLLMLIVLFGACESRPKVISGEPMAVAADITDFESPMADNFHSEESVEHRVKVQEVLNTAKYTYLHVTENQDSFWIAIPLKEVEVGARYYYQGGLLKRHFHSKEFDKVFETVYLVSDVIKLNEDGTLGSLHVSSNKATTEPLEVLPVEGGVTLAELFADPTKYQGKTISITGKCVKVNPMIMERNWVHIQDGSGEDLDLTVTTNENVLLGTVVTLEGIIALDKDFGAGYRYDIILEAAVVK